MLTFTYPQLRDITFRIFQAAGAPADEAGIVAIMYANSHGAGKFVAPWGGIDRRLSANPVSIAIPRSSSPPILVDISTCAIAEGKVRSLLNGEKQLPPNCVIDANGQPSTNP